MKVTKPVVNINGSASETLVSDAREAYEALNTALGKLRAMYPHGRDFQGAVPGTYERARSEHDWRLKTVEHVLYEVAELSNLAT